MGGLQVQQPALGKEPIRPSVVILSIASTSATATFPENVPETHTDPAIETFEDPGGTAMSKVRKPAAKCLVDIVDDERQRVTRRLLRLLAQRVFQLLQTLFARDTVVPLKEVSQESKAFHSGIHDLRFGRVQRQPVLRDPSANQVQCSFRIFCGSTENHKVVGVTYHLVPILGQQIVERVEIDIAEQRGKHGPLRGAGFRCPCRHFVQNARFQKGTDQLQDRAVGGLFFRSRHQKFVGNGVEVALQVSIYNVDQPLVEQPGDSPQVFREGRLRKSRRQTEGYPIAER